MDYNSYTVVELKALIKERNALSFNCKKKADYVAALVDDDTLKKSMADLHTGLDKMSADMQKSMESIKTGTTKIREACSVADIKIKSLKDKEDKTIDDYKILVELLEKRMKLMKDF